MPNAVPLQTVHVTLQFRNVSVGQLFVDDLALQPVASPESSDAVWPRLVIAMRPRDACKLRVHDTVTFVAASTPSADGTLTAAPGAPNLTACVHLSLDRLQHAVRPSRPCCISRSTSLTLDDGTFCSGWRIAVGADQLGGPRRTGHLQRKHARSRTATGRNDRSGTGNTRSQALYVTRLVTNALTPSHTSS